mgnify:CR=1 FL=1
MGAGRIYWGQIIVVLLAVAIFRDERALVVHVEDAVAVVVAREEHVAVARVRAVEAVAREPRFTRDAGRAPAVHPDGAEVDGEAARADDEVGVIGLESARLFGFRAPFFGVAIAIIGCYNGMTTRGGTEGVGQSTTRTVVAAAIALAARRARAPMSAISASASVRRGVVRASAFMAAPLSLLM